MANIEKEIQDKFGGRLRVRVNGVLLQDNAILMVRHKMGQGKSFWNVPGGGMKFGASAAENLEREFLEETGLQVKPLEYLTTYEYLQAPLHAMELFFLVQQQAGTLQLGQDPELAADAQLISEVRFMSIEELHNLPKPTVHPLFWDLKSLNDVRNWKGYFNFENKCIK